VRRSPSMLGAETTIASSRQGFEEFCRVQRARAALTAALIHARYRRRVAECQQDLHAPHVEDRGIPQPWARDSRHRNTE